MGTAVSSQMSWSWGPRTFLCSGYRKFYSSERSCWSLKLTTHLPLTSTRSGSKPTI